MRPHFLSIYLAWATATAMAWPTAASAKVEVTMTARPSRVSVGDQLSLSVTIKVSATVRSGGIFGGASFRNYQPPGLTDFDIARNWTNQSTQLSIVGGSAQREELFTYYYLVRPRRAGTLTISPKAFQAARRLIRLTRLVLGFVVVGPNAGVFHHALQLVTVAMYSRVMAMASSSGIPPSIRLFLNSETALPMLLAASGENRLPRMPLSISGSFVERVSKISATS